MVAKGILFQQDIMRKNSVKFTKNKSCVKCSQNVKYTHKVNKNAISEVMNYVRTNKKVTME
ncbi:hypothetical protein CNEO3_280054 [Clostridium neonatale]|nr:hypothetical protein CNEO4_1170089 [Clostridium neonatale]CAI3605873.1 hypothetical protein CNEO3_260055 [Clostridium neonatale]CAI3635325.1 hypothetical protein CNEO3_300054 [Clostridium neonatale]CAI3636886.1 hypothetical protein CNEO3_280054 [Clostridium neonatale]CAI3637721.1 hypothetical protein CNEO3_340048 [Clostridium neonatale]